MNDTTEPLPVNHPVRSGHPLWDLPTRTFHWAVVLCIPLAWWSGEEGEYDIHTWVGYTVICLVATRVVWGFVGSRHSRFSDFLVGPRAVLAYLRGAPPRSAGHNPLGGWSVLAMLLLLSLQGFSGLFNHDDVSFKGPLYHAAGAGFRDAMGGLHETTFYLLLALVCLHLAAVLHYQFRRRQQLVQAMLRGRSPGREGRSSPAPWWAALLILLLVALALRWGLSLAPRPPPLW